MSEPEKTDCFLKSLADKSRNYLVMLTEEEYFAYHSRTLKKSLYNHSIFNALRLTKVEPPIETIAYTYIMRSQEPFEEEILLAKARILV